MDTKTRIEVVNAALNGEGFQFDADNLGDYLLDEEGARALRLPADFVEVVEGLPPVHIPIVLRQVYLAHLNSVDRSFRQGKRAGRAEIVNTVHELLGIDKLQESLSVLETAMRETR